eukprot:GAHX01000669.1.p1 GENE.GAHX01000669.1~~GAHX01000669.1.p1  ORF type:complete len:313 (+),score=74.10 GAHX01000669.1:39-977(+)
MLQKLILDSSAFINSLDLSDFYLTNPKSLTLISTNFIEDELSNFQSPNTLKHIRIVQITKEQISKIRLQLKKICPKEALLLSDADVSLIQLYTEAAQQSQQEDLSLLSFNSQTTTNSSPNHLIDKTDGGWVTDKNITFVKENSFSESNEEKTTVILLTADKALIKAMSLLGYHAYYTEKGFSIHNISTIVDNTNINTPESGLSEDLVGKLICRTCKFVQDEGSYFCSNCSNVNLKRLTGTKSDLNLNWKSKKFNLKTKVVKGRKPLNIRREDQLEFEIKKARWNKRKEPKVILTPKAMESKRFGRARKEGIN